jgi:RNA polymerase sigma factor (TIGR02999 family)
MEIHKKDQKSFEELFPQNYSQIKGLARKIRWFLGSQKFKNHTTELVHEVYLNLHGKEYNLKNKQHFMRLVAKSVRYTIINEYNRIANNTQKENIFNAITLNEEIMTQEDIEVLEKTNSLHVAISKLEMELDERKASILEMRYFGQMRLEDIAQNLEISLATVKRDLLFAQSWLFNEMNSN